MAKLFVGGLPWATTNEELSELFTKAGQVNSASIIQDKMTGRSRGFGFVEMSDEDASKAIDMFNGQEYGGRKLVVNEAKPREDRPRRSFGGGGNRGGQRHGGYDRGHGRDEYND